MGSRGGGRAWLCEARAFQRARPARATKEPGSRQGELRGLRRARAEVAAGRGLAWGRSRGPTPAPPGRCLAFSEELGVGFNGGRGNGAGDRSPRGLPGLKTTPFARRGSPESVHPGPGLRCPTWGPGSKVCKVGRRGARTRAAPGENWPQTHGAHRSPK